MCLYRQKQTIPTPPLNNLYINNLIRTRFPEIFISHLTLIPISKVPISKVLTWLYMGFFQFGNNPVVH